MIAELLLRPVGLRSRHSLAMKLASARAIADPAPVSGLGAPVIPYEPMVDPVSNRQSGFWTNHLDRLRQSWLPRYS